MTADRTERPALGLPQPAGSGQHRPLQVRGQWRGADVCHGQRLRRPPGGRHAKKWTENLWAEQEKVRRDILVTMKVSSDLLYLKIFHRGETGPEL